MFLLLVHDCGEARWCCEEEMHGHMSRFSGGTKARLLDDNKLPTGSFTQIPGAKAFLLQCICGPVFCSMGCEGGWSEACELDEATTRSVPWFPCGRSI